MSLMRRSSLGCGCESRPDRSRSGKPGSEQTDRITQQNRQSGILCALSVCKRSDRTYVSLVWAGVTVRALLCGEEAICLI